MIGFIVEITNDVITGLGKKFQKVWRAAMDVAVRLYHRDIFPKHFFNSNRSRYRMQPRSDFYLKVIKPRRGLGTGRFVDNVLKGTSRRRMMNFATVRKTDGGNTVVLRMQAPRYFTNPFVGSYIDEKGERKTIGSQPDKLAEVTQVNQDDKNELGKIVQAKIFEKYQAVLAKKARKTI